MTSEYFRSITLRLRASQSGSLQDRLAGAGGDFFRTMIIYANQSVYTQLRKIANRPLYESAGTAAAHIL